MFGRAAAAWCLAVFIEAVQFCCGAAGFSVCSSSYAFCVAALRVLLYASVCFLALLRCSCSLGLWCVAFVCFLVPALVVLVPGT